jgi:diguanylate cyclase (GGDEF)-like protein
MQNQHKQSGKRHDVIITVFSILLIVLVSVVDVLTGDGFSLSIMYLLPISLSAWFVGMRSGIVMAVLSAAALRFSTLHTETLQVPRLIYYWDIFVNLVFFLTIAVILSALRSSLQREQEMARTDSLTGVASVQYFLEVAGTELNKALRYGRPLTVAYLAIDDFKAINDRFGHTIGDMLLRVTAATIRQDLRKTDLVARLGNDEFALILVEAGYDMSEATIGRIHKSLVGAAQQRGWPVTFSIGIATFLIPPATVDELIKFADELMVSVKSSGKNMVRHEVYDK